ncbi:hypothetical protein FO519_009626 [Halicephalobus sp. NKZ332]|nr:hypothetical protein FO519_009626 [Halicephalobus sp. NKZ332]
MLIFQVPVALTGMGLLTEGTPLTWAEISPLVEYLKQHGITQFISLYHQFKEREDNVFKWGDEIEYTVVKFDHENRKVRVNLRVDQLLKKLYMLMNANKIIGNENKTNWIPEFNAYMIESTPGAPYEGIRAFLNDVENNMILRRAQVSRLLTKDESLLSISFPALGTPDFTDPPVNPNPSDPEGLGHSLFFPDEAVFQGHPRSNIFVKGTQDRRGEKVAINVPIFKDVNTPSPFIEKFNDEESAKAAKPDHIYLDHRGFGMGCCCLQMTFQAANVDEARWLYDQLAPIAPIFLALSAATPIFRGYLSDVDSRWDVISASVDDRTREERGLVPLQKNKFAIKKSRYHTTDCYIHPSSDAYNDVELEYDPKVLQQLLDGGIDGYMAKYIAHMFIRDPLQVFREKVEQDDEESAEHFETILTSNWMSMRFKPPPRNNSQIGWRVEFRPTEVQLTEFENAAYCCFVVLLTRVIASRKFNFVVPISKVDENMARAQKRDAVLKEKFHFRLNIKNSGKAGKHRVAEDPHLGTAEMTVDEIVNGNGKGFLGLVPLIYQYLDETDLDVNTRSTITQYLSFIQKRASGEICTLAHWMRAFVARHPSYKKDSHVNDEIIYDMLKKMDEISRGNSHCKNLLGKFR